MLLPPRRRYTLLAQFWTVAFLVTGLIFWLAPAQLGAQMQGTAQLLGLQGSIDCAPDSMWHVIALSLMVTVAMLSWQTAQDPDARAPYATLQAAKLSSTLLFLLLAARHGSIWILAALTDGGIALSLFLARRALPKR